MYKQIEETPEFWAFEEMQEIKRQEAGFAMVKFILVWVFVLLFCLSCWAVVCYYLFHNLLKWV